MCVSRRDVKPWQDAETLAWACEKENTHREVADKLGVGRRTVDKWTIRHNLREVKPWQDAETLEYFLYDKEYCQNDIARRFNLSQDSVAYWIEKNGLTQFECEECGAAIATEFGLKLHHYQKHDSIAGVEKECANCGGLVRRPPSHMDGERFCSKECHYEWRSENVTGEDHFNWKGGKNPDYGDGWNDEKKQAVRERDGFQCDSCGMDQEQHIKTFGCKLHVHHITPWDEFDDPKKRNAMENLRALCCQCHMRIEQQ